MSVKSFRERNPVVVGIVSIALISAAVAFAFSINRFPAITRVYALEAEFADAAGLARDNQVRIAGIKVGTVRSVELEGDRVLVTMDIDRGIQVPADAAAEIKLATILGTKFVDLKAAGSGPYFAAGDRIPLDRTKIPYEIYQAANQGTAVLEGLDGDALNAALAKLAEVVAEARDEVGIALEGVHNLGAGLNANRDDLESMLSGADELTRLLADEGDQLNRLIDTSDSVLASLASQREELQSLLFSTRAMAGELTDLLRTNRADIDRILNRLHRALKVLEANVEHLDLALEFAGPSSRYFGQVLQQGPWADIYTCALVTISQCEGGP